MTNPLITEAIYTKTCPKCAAKLTPLGYLKHKCGGKHGH